MAVLAISALGGAVGFGIGGLAGFAGLGASIGWSIGSYIGNMLFGPEPPTIEGPRMRDTTMPAGAEGSGIPILYGTTRTMTQVIWSAEILETRHEEEVEVGKGGSQTQTTVTYTYSCSWAVGCCEGSRPGSSIAVVGIRRIWADSKLIYSVSENADPATFIANSERGIIRAYSGSSTQTADPTIAAAVGAANAPAYRGTCYIVFENFQLADFGNRRPAIEAEVVVAGTVSNPTKTHNLSPTFLPQFMSTDPRRGSMVACEQTIAEGEYLYRWDGGDDAPVPWAALPLDIANVASIRVDSDLDEIVIFEDAQTGNSNFVRFDAATGSVNGSGEYSFAGVDGDTPVCRGNFQYDPNWEIFWSIGDGFTNGYLFLLGLKPNDSGGFSSLEHSLYGPNVGSITLSNQEAMIDADDRMWFVTQLNQGLAFIKTHPTSPEVFVDLGVSANPEAAFFWSARDEIWVPRSTGHSTDGWRVFNTVSETFSNSTSLGLGSWTVSYERGVENEDGYGWFFNKTPVSNLLNGTLRDSSGSEVQSFTALYAEAATIRSLRYQPGVIYLDTGSYFRSVYEYALTRAGIGLDEVVTDICDRAGLTSSFLDVSELAADTVRGFQLARPMSARAALEPLMGAFSFDGVESDGDAVFVKRGGASVATLTDEDLAATDGDSSEDVVETVITTRAMETELPSTIYLQFNNIDLDYNVGIARARRLVTDSEHLFTIEMPIVFTSEEANQVVDRLMRFAWLERERFQFTLKPRWRKLDPTDVVTLPDGRRVRLTKIDYSSNGPLQCEGVSDDDGAINSYAEGNDAETGTGDTLGASGLTTGIVLDVPLLRDIDSDEGLYFAACGEPNRDWPGAVFYVSRDDGNNWAGVIATNQAAKIGVVIDGELISDHDGRSWDHQSRIKVRLNDTALALTPASGLEAFYNGENACAIGKDGEWEIAQYYSVLDHGDDTYTLYNWLRGRKGTEWAMPLHEDRTSSTLFVGLSVGPVVRSGFSLNFIDSESLWRAVTFGGNILETPSRTQTFQGVSATPLAPVEVGGVRHANGDWRARWTRRARELAEWRNSSDVPLDETTEEYELEIWDTAFTSLKRTVTDVGTVGYTYTGSTAASDFGETPYGIGLKVYQISDRVGRGYGGVGAIVTPLMFDVTRCSSNITLTDSVTIASSGLTVTRSGGANIDLAITNRRFKYGTHYWEVLINSTGGTNCIAAGITSVTSTYPNGNTVASSELKMVRADGEYFAVGGGTIFTFTSGDRLMFAWNPVSRMLFGGKNGTWQNSADPARGLLPQWTYTPSLAYAPGLYFNSTASQARATCFFDKNHLYTCPPGFEPLYGETINDHARTDLG